MDISSFITSSTGLAKYFPSVISLQKQKLQSYGQPKDVFIRAQGLWNI